MAADNVTIEIPIQNNDHNEKSINNRSKRITDDKNRRKDEKSIENLIKYLSTDEKLKALTSKCIELLKEQRISVENLKRVERNYTVLKCDYDKIVLEKKRQTLISTRLENLCRELQKQNRTILNETTKQLKEERNNRETISKHFESSMSEINKMIQDGREASEKLRKENSALNTKLELLAVKVQQRDEQIQGLTKQMDLERQISEATIEQHKCELQAVKEIHRQEKENIINKVNAEKSKCNELCSTSELLHQQTLKYKEHCEELQSALEKSNIKFEQFQAQMTKMTKHIEKMEVESCTNQNKWKETNLKLIKLSTENDELKLQHVQYEKQISVLKNLCRTMQNERKKFIESNNQIISDLDLKSDLLTTEKPDKSSTTPNNAEKED